jgi:hypothetical protein
VLSPESCTWVVFTHYFEFFFGGIDTSEFPRHQCNIGVTFRALVTSKVTSCRRLGDLPGALGQASAPKALSTYVN